jgi:DNA-binding NarL/FixJ family response regulator
VAGVAPAGLLLTTEALRHLAKTIIERQAAVSTLAELSGQRDKLAADVDTHRAELDKLNGQIEAARVQIDGQIGEMSRSVHDLNDARQVKIDQRRASVLALLSEGLAPADIAGELNVTVRTIKRDITALNGQVRVTQ